MTYRLNPAVCKIQSPICLRFVGENLSDQYFPDGAHLAMKVFEKSYIIESVTAQDNQILINVEENRRLNDLAWASAEDAEAVSFF